MSLVNLVVTLLALLVVDRAGRKTLMLAGTCIQCIRLPWWAGCITRMGTALRPDLRDDLCYGARIGTALLLGRDLRNYPTKVRGLPCPSPLRPNGCRSLGNQIFPVIQVRIGNDDTFSGCLSFASLVAGSHLTLSLVPETKALRGDRGVLDS